MPIPDLSNKPGPGRPGWSAGTYDFQFEVAGSLPVTIKAQPAATGTFTIKWPNGTEQTTTGSNSITAPDATEGIVSINKKTDATYADEFAVVGNKTAVTKVISWGQNPWNRLQDAFKDCTNLTEISTTSLITDTTGNLTSLFSGCTGLTEAIIKNWDLSQGARLSNLFNNCTNLEKTDWTGLNIKLTAESPRILYAAGSTTTNGCEFLMSNINLSTSTTARLGNAGQGLWQNSKIKANSNFSGWTFPSGIVYAQLSSVFQNASVPASNATINISNWSFAGNTYTQNNLQNAFNSFNSAAGNASTGLKLNMSNWNFGDARWTMESMFNSFKGDQIIGLSTWTVGSGAIYNMKSWAQSTFNLKILSNDNISNSFASSININTGTQYAFQNMSSNYTLESDWGVFPNLSGADFSSNPVLTAMFMNTRFTTPPNLDNVTFHPGGASNNYESFMSGMKLSGSQGVDFTNVTMKPSRFNSAFQQADIAFLKFGSGVDFSEVGRIESFAYLATMPDNTLEFATNLSFGSLTNSSNFPGHKMSVCQTDNFIRRLYATQPTDAGVTSGSIYFDNSAVTESPSVVRNTANLLVSPGGWSLNGLNSTDATMPFAYPSYSFDSEVTQSVTPTTVPSGGQFSSTDPSVTVDENTGVVSWANGFMGTPTIRCTYTDGCYNEVQMSMLVTVDNNYSMAFDGTGSYMNVTSDPLKDGATNFSFSTWVKKDAAATFNHTILQSWQSPAWLLFRYVSGTHLHLYFGSTTRLVDETLSSLGLNNNNWNHIAVVNDYDNSKLKIYVNGDLKYTRSSTQVAYQSNTSPLQIGGGTYPNYWNGEIDEVGIFNRALTESQVKLIYDANSTNKSIKLSSLPGGAPIAWYRMGD